MTTVDLAAWNSADAGILSIENDLVSSKRPWLDDTIWLERNVTQKGCV